MYRSGSLGATLSDAHLARSGWASPVEEMAFGHGDLRDVRRLVAEAGHHAGVGDARVDDLVLAVNELAANSIDHGGGSGTMLIWTETGALVIEVHDRGALPDIQAVPQQPDPEADRGRGLWLAYQLADLVQVRRTESGTVARVLTWLDRG